MAWFSAMPLSRRAPARKVWGSGDVSLVGPALAVCGALKKWRSLKPGLITYPTRKQSAANYVATIGADRDACTGVWVLTLSSKCDSCCF